MMNTREYNATYYQIHKDDILAKAKNRLLINPTYNKKRRLALKLEVLSHYGNGKCSCVSCGESRLGCLSLDHIKDNRTEETKFFNKPRYWGGPTFYHWLRKHNFPEGYQTLCMNCQWLKRSGDL